MLEDNAKLNNTNVLNRDRTHNENMIKRNCKFLYQNKQQYKYHIIDSMPGQGNTSRLC